MIITRSPLRISLGGGSTDIPSFFTKFGSFLVGFAISAYVYTTVRYTPDILDHNYLIHYSKTEEVDKVADIAHNGVRGVLQYLNVNRNLEISNLLDIPARTGLGSSSAFVVSLLHAVKLLKQEKIYTKKQLAEDAIYVERTLLAEAGGLQDGIWAAYGGLNSIEIKKNGRFYVRPLPVSPEFLHDFRTYGLLIYLGESRNSFEIAASHNVKEAENHKKEILQEAIFMYNAFVDEDIGKIAESIKRSWLAKKRTSAKISSPRIDGIIDQILQNGGYCAKLLGAGGNGFLFVLAPPAKHTNILNAINLKKVDWDFDFEGSKVIL